MPIPKGVKLDAAGNPVGTFRTQQLPVRSTLHRMAVANRGGRMPGLSTYGSTGGGQTVYPSGVVLNEGGTPVGKFKTEQIPVSSVGTASQSDAMAANFNAPPTPEPADVVPSRPEPMSTRGKFRLMSGTEVTETLTGGKNFVTPSQRTSQITGQAKADILADTSQWTSPVPKPQGTGGMTPPEYVEKLMPIVAPMSDAEFEQLMAVQQTEEQRMYLTEARRTAREFDPYAKYFNSVA